MVYDDEPSPDGIRQAKGRSRGGSVLIAIIGVIIALIGVVFYLIFTPHTRTEVPVLLESVPVVLPDRVVEVPQQVQAAAVAEETVTVVEIPAEVVEEVPETGMLYRYYTIEEGDKIDTIADKLALQPATILSVNSIKNLNTLRAGNVLRYPDQDGQLYLVRAGDTAERIVQQKNPVITVEELMALNRMESIAPGDELFIPSPPKFASPMPGAAVLYQNGDYFEGESLVGVILQLEDGGEVLAAGDGTIIDWSNNGDEGYSVTLMHDDGYQTQYCYLSSLDQPSAGKKVKKGSRIGWASGLGMLFRLTQMGVSLDPELIIRF